MNIIREAFENVKNYLQLISVADIIDVLIMTFIIYKVLVLIRKTQAARVLKGIVLLVVALAIASLAGLNVINFLLSNTLQLGLIALLVLFQPELRRMLETVGGSGSLAKIIGKGDEDSGDMENVIAQVVSATSTLSQQKIGMLLVFERSIRLDEVVKTGTIVDSAVTSMLIRNIFFPKAALHDGATIIRDGRMLAAGCVLPLTTNNNLSPDLGTRHRAGVGVSEVSDAVVVIVSEETGSVSVAIGGMLKRHLKSDTLAALLRNELIPSEDDDEGKGVKKVIKRIKGKKNEGEN